MCISCVMTVLNWRAVTDFRPPAIRVTSRPHLFVSQQATWTRQFPVCFGSLGLILTSLDSMADWLLKIVSGLSAGPARFRLHAVQRFYASKPAC